MFLPLRRFYFPHFCFFSTHTHTQSCLFLGLQNEFLQRSISRSADSFWPAADSQREWASPPPSPLYSPVFICSELNPFLSLPPADSHSHTVDLTYTAKYTSDVESTVPSRWGFAPLCLQLRSFVNHPAQTPRHASCFTTQQETTAQWAHASEQLLWNICYCWTAM